MSRYRPLFVGVKAKARTAPKSKPMEITKGERGDMSAVLDLIRELAVFENAPDAVVITAEDLIRDGFGEIPLFHTIVARTDGKIVGVALYYYRYSTWKGPTIHLEDLIVSQAHRGSGIGFALYSEIIKQGKRDNVRRIEWNVLNWNTPAIEFYKRSGAKILDDWLVVQMDEAGISEFLQQSKI